MFRIRDRQSKVRVRVWFRLAFGVKFRVSMMCRFRVLIRVMVRVTITFRVGSSTLSRSGVGLVSGLVSGSGIGKFQG